MSSRDNDIFKIDDRNNMETFAFTNPYSKTRPLMRLV